MLASRASESSRLRWRCKALRIAGNAGCGHRRLVALRSRRLISFSLGGLFTLLLAQQLELLQILAARAAIQDATPIAVKNTTAIQACGSGSLLAKIANAIVAAANPHR
jgi:hypothetical protein